MKNYHIFISHAWKYSNDYNTIISWLRSAPQLNLFNYSVPEHKNLATEEIRLSEHELKSKLIEQIAHASVVLIIAGMYAAYSDWIEFELKTAKTFEKPIIGIRPYQQERIPQIISDNADEVVSWMRQSVIDAIRKRAL